MRIEDTIKEIIETTLEIPVFYAADSIVFPGATVEAYLDTPELHGDGVCVSNIISVQIDLWYEDRTDRNAATALLKPALMSISATSLLAELRYDSTAKKWRATIHFDVIGGQTDGI